MQPPSDSESFMDYVEAGILTADGEADTAFLAENEKQTEKNNNLIFDKTTARSPPPKKRSSGRSKSKSRLDKNTSKSRQSKPQSLSRSRKSTTTKRNSEKFKLQGILSSEDDEMWTMKSVVSTWTIGTGFTERYEIDKDLEDLLHSNDIEYVKKRFGVLSIMVTILQLFILTMLISLCGCAPFSVNSGIGPYPDALSNAGGTNPYLLASGHEYWRLFVSPLIPASVIHFLLNSVVQIEVGAFLEKEWGSRKWAAIYFFSGIGSVAFSCALSPEEVTVGGSGALLGLIGAKLSEFTKIASFRTKKYNSDDFYYQQSVLMIFIALFVIALSAFQYISVAGAVGGFFCGFVMGMVLLSSNIRKKNDKILWLGSGVILALLMTVICFSMIGTAVVSEDLGNACRFYDEVHVENYDCTCGF